MESIDLLKSIDQQINETLQSLPPEQKPQVKQIRATAKDIEAHIEKLITSIEDIFE